jgi:hypothetical protein
MIRLLVHPLPPPLSRQEVVSLSQSSCVLTTVELSDGRVGFYFFQKYDFEGKNDVPMLQVCGMYSLYTDPDPAF